MKVGGKTREWFPEGGKGYLSGNRVEHLGKTLWVLATGGSLVTSVRAVSRCGGHRGQNGWGEKGLGSKEWSQQGKISRQRSLDAKESIQERAGCGRCEERVLLLREEGPGEI